MTSAQVLASSNQLQVAVLAGVVALVVSCITAFVQLQVSKRSREATVWLADRDKATAQEFASGGAFNALVQSGVTLRNRCWELAAQLRAMVDEPAIDGARLVELETELHGQVRTFLDTWGSVANLPDVDLLPALRQSRHHCMTELDTVFVRFAVLLGRPSDDQMLELVKDVDRANRTVASFLDVAGSASRG